MATEPVSEYEKHSKSSTARKCSNQCTNEHLVVNRGGGTGARGAGEADLRVGRGGRARARHAARAGHARHHVGERVARTASARRVRVRARRTRARQRRHLAFARGRRARLCLRLSQLTAQVVQTLCQRRVYEYDINETNQMKCYAYRSECCTDRNNYYY